MRVDRGKRGKHGKFLGLGFCPIASIIVVFGWFLEYFFSLIGAKLTNFLTMWLEIPLSYMCSRKLGHEGELSVCGLRCLEEAIMITLKEVISIV